MASRAWDEDLEIGVESIDAEHRLQVSLVKTLEDLLLRGTDPALASRTMTQLVEFTAIHFLSEELMMNLYAYPQGEAHKAEHGRLTKQVAEIQRSLERGEPGAALQTIGLLHRWLAGHIVSMDRAFALWCAKSGLALR